MHKSINKPHTVWSYLTEVNGCQFIVLCIFIDLYKMLMVQKCSDASLTTPQYWLFILVSGF
ncbi:MAG: hypothetical protein V8R07_03555 [Bacteroides fragilis]